MLALCPVQLWAASGRINVNVISSVTVLFSDVQNSPSEEKQAVCVCTDWSCWNTRQEGIFLTWCLKQYPVVCAHRDYISFTQWNNALHQHFDFKNGVGVVGGGVSSNTILVILLFSLFLGTGLSVMVDKSFVCVCVCLCMCLSVCLSAKVCSAAPLGWCCVTLNVYHYEGRTNWY